MILSILGPQLHCEWMLPGYKVALITSVKSPFVLFCSQLIVQCALMFNVTFLLPQVVFVGMGISSPVWGNVSDRYGRKVVSSLISVFFIYDMVIFIHFTHVKCSCFCDKQGLTICMCWSLFYGLLSAFAPVYGWLLVLRGLVGFGIGGAPQS